MDKKVNGETVGLLGGREGAQKESFGLVTIMAKRGKRRKGQLQIHLGLQGLRVSK